mgnify:CR=1 FL=1
MSYTLNPLNVYCSSIQTAIFDAFIALDNKSLLPVSKMLVLDLHSFVMISLCVMRLALNCMCAKPTCIELLHISETLSFGLYTDYSNTNHINHEIVTVRLV